MRSIRNNWRTIKTGSSLIAIVNKNITGLKINTSVNHSTSIQIDGAPISSFQSISFFILLKHLLIEVAMILQVYIQ